MVVSISLVVRYLMILNDAPTCTMFGESERIRLQTVIYWCEISEQIQYVTTCDP